MIEEFLNNRLWVHITSEDMDLVKELKTILPDIRFADGRDIDGAAMDNALGHGEAWFRYEKGLRFCLSHPRKSTARDLSPWIYDNGEIINIDELVNDRKIEFSEDDIVNLMVM